MTVYFSIGHVGGGTKRVEVSPGAVDAELVSLVEELYDADDEHYQGYVVNSAGAGMTTFDGGLMAWDENVGAAESVSRYYRPVSLAEAVEILNASTYGRKYLPTSSGRTSLRPIPVSTSFWSAWASSHFIRPRGWETSSG
jgi:hypothetical protein